MYLPISLAGFLGNLFLRFLLLLGSTNVSSSTRDHLFTGGYPFHLRFVYCTVHRKYSTVYVGYSGVRHARSVWRRCGRPDQHNGGALPAQRLGEHCHLAAAPVPPALRVRHHPEPGVAAPRAPPARASRCDKTLMTLRPLTYATS